MDLFIYIIIVLLIIGFIVTKFKASAPKKDSQPQNNASPYKSTEFQQKSSQFYLKKYFLTLAEAEFYRLLHRYLHNTQYYIFSQVSYSAIHNKKLNKGYSLNSYFIDFLICTHDFRPVCAIELDDLTHRNDTQVMGRDHVKNEFFNSIKKNCRDGEKFEFFRIPFNTKNDFSSAANIEFTKKFSELLFYLLEKETCTVCNSPMIVCRNKATATFFWGCPRYKEAGHSGKGKDILNLVAHIDDAKENDTLSAASAEDSNAPALDIEKVEGL